MFYKVDEQYKKEFIIKPNKVVIHGSWQQAYKIQKYLSSKALLFLSMVKWTNTSTKDKANGV